MKRFIAHYTSRTCASIADRKAQQTSPIPAWKFSFQGSGNSVSISDLLKTDSGINVHSGLRFFVEVHVESEAEVEEVAKSHCELILNLITLTTQTSCQPAKLQGIIELTDSPPYPFSSISYPLDEGTVQPQALRKIDQPTFQAVYDAFTADPAGRGRIARALSWLRKGLNENDQTDEFVSYWVGIEVIAALLRDKLQMSRPKPTQWEGVEDIFIRKLGVNNFSDIKTARDELLHGFKELNSTFVSTVRSYREPARKALIFSICELLNLPPDVETKIVGEKVIRGGGQFWIVTRGTLSGVPSDFDELIKNFPHIQSDFTASESTLTEDGKINRKGSFKHRMVGPAETTWTTHAVELRGDSDTGIENASVSVEGQGPETDSMTSPRESL
jgi:hypothetical protein